MTSSNSQIRTCIIYLAVESVIYLVLAFYLDEVIPKEYGSKKSPFFFLTETFGFIKKKIFGKKNENKNIINSNKFDSTHNILKLIDENEDEDVSNERKKVNDFDFEPQDFPLVVKNLRKEFSSGVFSKSLKVAVNDICFSLDESVTLGILGINGAGEKKKILQFFFFFF